MKVAGYLFLTALAGLVLSLTACEPTAAHNDTPDPNHDLTVYVKETNGTISTFDHVHGWGAGGSGTRIELNQSYGSVFCVISMQNIVWISEKKPN